jgi:RNA polymerase sigma-70 factor (ECF subfamily)
MDETGPGATVAATQAGPVAVAAGTREVSRAAAGDALAFRRLYEEHLGRILALARRMLGPEEAQEATQDAFVRAWEKLHTFRGEAAFGTWLYRVAINVFVARRGKMAQRRARHLEGDEVLETIAAKPAATDFGIDFEGAIQRLPDGARQIFVLHDVEGYKHEEIAGMLGVTSGTSKAQLHRARMLLRRALTRSGPAAGAAGTEPRTQARMRP